MRRKHVYAGVSAKPEYIDEVKDICKKVVDCFIQLQCYLQLQKGILV